MFWFILNSHSQQKQGFCVAWVTREEVPKHLWQFKGEDNFQVARVEKLARMPGFKATLTSDKMRSLISLHNMAQDVSDEMRMHSKQSVDYT